MLRVMPYFQECLRYMLFVHLLQYVEWWAFLATSLYILLNIKTFKCLHVEVLLQEITGKVMPFIAMPTTTEGIIYYAHKFMWYVMTPPCNNSNGSLTKAPLRLGHRCIVPSHCLYVITNTCLTSDAGLANPYCSTMIRHETSNKNTKI